MKHHDMDQRYRRDGGSTHYMARKFRTWIDDEEPIVIDLDALDPEPRIEAYEHIPKALRQRIYAICQDDRLTKAQVAKILDLPVEWIERVCREYHYDVHIEKLDN